MNSALSSGNDNACSVFAYLSNLSRLAMFCGTTRVSWRVTPWELEGAVIGALVDADGGSRKG
jgi:hypothetical protein